MAQATSTLLDNLPVTKRNVKAVSSNGMPPTDTPDWIWEVDHPYLHGVFDQDRDDGGSAGVSGGRNPE